MDSLYSKPLSTFAQDFLRFLFDRFYITRGKEIDWMPRVRVIICGQILWKALWPLYQKTKRHNLSEYKEPSNTSYEYWTEKVNGMWWGPVAENEAGEKVGLSEKDRKEVGLNVELPSELNEMFESCDLFIFINEFNVTQAEQFQRYMGKTSPVQAMHSVVAHECVHIIEAISGQFMIENFDNIVTFEASEVVILLGQFLSSISLTEFKRHYTTCNEGSPV